MIAVKNIFSKKAWVTTASFHAFKQTQILIVPPNHSAAYAHLLLQMNIWILLNDPLYRKTWSMKFVTTGSSLQLRNPV